MYVKNLVTMSLKVITLSFIFFVCFMSGLQAQDKTSEDKRNQVIVHADGSKTIITYSVNEKGEEIKTVTVIKNTEFLNGSKLISKTVKIFNYVKNEEVLHKSFVQNSIVRPRRRVYRDIRKNNPNVSLPGISGSRITNVSPDGM